MHWMMLFLLFAADTEKKINKSDLPPAVAAAMDKASQGGRVVGYAKEVEGGKTSYELELKVNGKTRDTSFDSEGNVLSVEEEVAMASLPQAVQDGLKKAAGKGRVTMVESVTAGGKTVYEGHVKGGAAKEVKVDGSGNLIGTEK